jgi:hypothetical protein
MGTELRYPNITGVSERDQLVQMKSYLHQLVDQLQYALNNVGASSSSAAVVVRTRSSVAQPSSGSNNPVATFDSIKALIIKSADIVNAYYDEISNRLEGLYVAESDFGTYEEETAQVINQNSTNIDQLFTNEQSIITDIENLNFTLADVNAHIRSGLLDYDDNDIPVYGLEIGQKNVVDGEEVFNAYARFTADRLSFYDQNDSEVAYISDYKLYIRNVEITSSYKIGGFVYTVMANGNVVTKWVGGV